MPSSKAKGTPQPSLQNTTTSTNATGNSDRQTANNSHGTVKAPPRNDNEPAKSSVPRSGPLSQVPQHPTAETVSGHAAPTIAPIGVNRKKQKRREKQAAKLAAGQQTSNGYASGDLDQNGHLTQTDNDLDGVGHSIQKAGYADPDFDDPDQYGEGEDLYYTDEEGGRLLPATNGAAAHLAQGTSSKKSKKKKKKNQVSTQQSLQNHHLEGSSTSVSTPSASTRPHPPPPPPLSNAALRASHKISNRDRIWNTSTAEERERIKEFWLELGEDDRRSLVKVEKDAVLKKMKEQQKHSCSCTVCGRKRTAIEEELEILYDAYYEELEQYANHNQGFADGAPIMPPRMYNNPLPRATPHHLLNPQLPPKGKVTEASDDEDADEEEYDDDEDEDVDYSDDELEEELPAVAHDFFAFGNSLTVKEGILTVADDLLKNDGRKFIDMMEQLAERRMQREEETQYAASALAHQTMHGHNHGPQLEEDEFDDEEEEEDYGSEDEDYEDDDMAMTEEQRMEEGRRMFQIFAARMFEQRVLTAYREKVARERQQKLIQELEEENQLSVQREAKKAREAQKKKDKKKLQKQAKEEEKAKREAEKAAEEAKLKAIEEKKQEELRLKKEEQRKKKEAERKAQEEERLKREAEKQRKQQEDRERQLEAERRQKEQREREKKKRDEAKKREREEREAKEKELRERKVQEERERKAQDEQLRKEKEKTRRDKEGAVKAEKETKERAKKDDIQPALPASQGQKRGSQVPIHGPPGLHPPSSSTTLQSPHFQIATPVVPKAPTPGRQRQSSQQGSHASSPRSQQAVADSVQSASPGNAVVSQSSIPPTPASSKTSQSPLAPPQTSAPMSPVRSQIGRAGSSGYNYDPSNMSAMGLPTTNAPMMPQGMSRPSLGHDLPVYPNHPPPLSGQYRGFAPNGIPMPPGINGQRMMSHGRPFPPDNMANFPMPSQAPMAAPMSAASRDPIRSQPHSRQPSATFEKPGHDNVTSIATQPIGRPAPIQRPSSTTPHERTKESSRQSRSDVDELSAQLGSSALLDDTDVPMTANMTDNTSVPPPPGAPGSGRLCFGASPLFPDTFGSSKIENHMGSHGGHGSTWGSHLPFGAPGMTGASWGHTPGWTAHNNAFGIIGGPHRPHASRPVTIRLLVIQACKNLSARNPAGDGYHDPQSILVEVECNKPGNEPPVSYEEMMDICDTEGNSQNGGGSFLIKLESAEGAGRKFVKFEPDSNSSGTTGRGGIAPGDIGSPVPSSTFPAFGGVVGSRQPFQSSPQAGF